MAQTWLWLPLLPLLPLLALADVVEDRAWEHFGLLNELRAEGYTCPNGQAYAPNPVALNFDCRLWRAAKLHSEDMALQNYFSHTSLDGRSPWDRAREQGISANGENIAAGRSSASGTLEQWKNSDGHCRNMMNPKFHVFAVGYAYDSAARYRHYWTQMLKSSDVSDLDTSCYPTTTAPSTTTGSATETLSATQSSTTRSSSGTTTATSTGTATTVTGSEPSTVTGSETSTSTETSTGSETTRPETSTGSETSGSETSGTVATTTETSSVTTAALVETTGSPGNETESGSISTSSSQGVTTTVEGRLELEVSEDVAFPQLEGPLRSWLASYLGVAFEDVSVWLPARRLGRRLSGLSVAYAVRAVQAEVMRQRLEVLEPVEATRQLEVELQEAGLELTVSVTQVEVVMPISLEQPWLLASPWPLAAGAVIFCCLGLICLACCCRRRKPKELPKDLPTIHGHLEPEMRKSASQVTMKSGRSECIVSHL